MDSTAIKETVIEFLKDKNTYEIVDEVLIDELTFNYELMQQAKNEMTNEDGTYELLSDITRDPDKEAFFQKNRLLDIYNVAFKNLKDIYIKLGLTVQERVRLKLALMESVDEFGDIFDG